jgi:hypothetical protein
MVGPWRVHGVVVHKKLKYSSHFNEELSVYFTFVVVAGELGHGDTFSGMRKPRQIVLFKSMSDGQTNEDDDDDDDPPARGVTGEVGSPETSRVWGELMRRRRMQGRVPAGEGEPTLEELPALMQLMQTERTPPKQEVTHILLFCDWLPPFCSLP